MFGWLKRNVAPVAAVAMFSLASVAAQALSVSFYTTGAFNGAPASPGASPVTLNVGDASLTFTGSTIVNQPLPASGAFTNVSFGSFTYTPGLDANDDSFIGTTFTLYITQTDPSASPDLGSFEGTAIQGTIFSAGAGLGLEIAFDAPHTIYIPDAMTAKVVYRVDPIEIPAGTPAVLGGQVAAAPLPGVAVVGAALMGGLGLIRRRRETVTA